MRLRTPDLNLPFAEPNSRNTAVHRILRPPPRQFPRTADFMHLLTREYIDWLLRAADTPAVYAETLVSRIAQSLLPREWNLTAGFYRIARFVD